MDQPHVGSRQPLRIPENSPSAQRSSWTNGCALRISDPIKHKQLNGLYAVRPGRARALRISDFFGHWQLNDIHTTHPGRTCHIPAANREQGLFFLATSAQDSRPERTVSRSVLSLPGKIAWTKRTILSSRGDWRAPLGSQCCTFVQDELCRRTNFRLYLGWSLVHTTPLSMAKGFPIKCIDNSRCKCFESSNGVKWGSVILDESYASNRGLPCSSMMDFVRLQVFML